MIITPLALNQVISDTPAFGVSSYFSIWIPERGYYTLEALPPSTLRAAILGPFDGVMTDDPALRQFMDSGLGPLGCIPLVPGNYLIRLDQLGTGVYNFNCRPWRNLLAWTMTEYERTDLH